MARLLPEGSERLSSQLVYWDEEEVARWSFDSAEAIAGWHRERIDLEYGPVPGGLAIRSSSPDPSLFREDVRVDASRVRVVRVRGWGLTTDAFMQLFWAPSDEPFTEARSLAVPRDDQTGAVVRTYTFPVWKHPGWKGTIGRIRLDPTSVPDKRMELYSVSALDLAVRDELVAPLLERSWRVDLRGDVRRAVLVPPGFPFEKELDVPRRAVLRVALGLEEGVEVPVLFRVVAEHADQRQTLLEETVPPSGSGNACHWSERVIDLGAYSRRRVKLTLETESPRNLDLLRGFPAFADLEVAVPGARRSRPNVVLVVVDTLRADRLSTYGYARLTTPHVDAWARQRGVVFERVVAQAPWTLPSHVTLLSGLDALTHGVNTDEPCSESLVMLAERLRDAGYSTQAITGGGYLATEYAVMQGFDRLRYHYEPHLDPDQTGNDIVQGMERALAWLGGVTDRPFFLFFHTYEVHSPYDAREPYFSRFHGGQSEGPPPQLSTSPKEARQEEGFLVKAWLRERAPGPQPGYRPFDPKDLPLLEDLYDSSVAFADEQVGRLLDRLATLGLDDQTLVVVTSDHGESVGEKGLAGHQSLQECELLVPLIVALPSGRSAGRRVPTQVRLVDLTPTVLDLLGLEPTPGMDGRSLAPLLKGNGEGFPEDAWSYAGSSNFGLGLRRANRLKYTYNNCPWPPIRGMEALYRVDSDPDETTNLVGRDGRAVELRELTRQHYESTTSGVRVCWANRTQVPMAGFLRGQIVTPLQVKELDHRVTGVEWRDQTFHFTLQPGDATTFFLEGAAYGEILVGADLPGLGPSDGGLRQVVSLDSLDTPWQMVYADSSAGVWHSDPSADLEQVTGVRVWLAGDRVRRGAGAVSDEARQQLRNLGYLQ